MRKYYYVMLQVRENILRGFFVKIIYRLVLTKNEMFGFL